MAKRSLRVVKNLGRTPAVAVCSVRRDIRASSGRIGKHQGCRGQPSTAVLWAQVRAKGFSPEDRADPRGKSIAYLCAGDAESEAKVEAPNLERLGRDAQNSWARPSLWLNAGESGNAGHSRRTVGLCLSEALTAWVGTERGKKEPVHIAAEGEDLLADLEQGLSYVRRRTDSEVLKRTACSNLLANANAFVELLLRRIIQPYEPSCGDTAPVSRRAFQDAHRIPDSERP